VLEQKLDRPLGKGEMEEGGFWFIYLEIKPMSPEKEGKRKISLTYANLSMGSIYFFMYLFIFVW
jgi:hypothetical protein